MVYYVNMKKIPYKVRVLITVLCFVTALEGLFAVGYLYYISAPVVGLVGTSLTIVVCIIAGIVFVPTHKPDVTPVVPEKKQKPKSKLSYTVYNKPTNYGKSLEDEIENEDDEEEEEEDEILAMEMLDDVLDD